MAKKRGEGGGEDREVAGISASDADPRQGLPCVSPASGTEGKAGWGPLATGLSGSGERLPGELSMKSGGKQGGGRS